MPFKTIWLQNTFLLRVQYLKMKNLLLASLFPSNINQKNLVEQGFENFFEKWCGLVHSGEKMG